MQQPVEGALLFLALHVGRFRLVGSLVQPTLDAGPLGAQDFLHAFFQVVHHRVQVALLELLAALLPEPVHEIAQVGHLRAVAVLHPVAEELAQGPGQVAVLQQVIGQRVHDVAGIDVKNLLGAIPLGVTVALVKHGRPPAGLAYINVIPAKAGIQTWQQTNGAMITHPPQGQAGVGDTRCYNAGHRVRRGAGAKAIYGVRR